MKSPEMGGMSPEKKQSLQEIADHYLNQLDQLQEGGTLFASMGTSASTFPIVPEKFREKINDVLDKFKSGQLSEEDAKKELLLGRTVLIVKNPETEK